MKNMLAWCSKNLFLKHDKVYFFVKLHMQKTCSHCKPFMIYRWGKPGLYNSLLQGMDSKKCAAIAFLAGQH